MKYVPLTILFNGLVLLNFAHAGEAPPAYEGSSFREIRRLVFETPDSPTDTPEIAAEKAFYRAGGLPDRPVTWESIWRKTSHGLINLLAIRSKKTVNEFPDYYERLEKIVHPTGVCFAGQWEITEATDYDGYFATGARGLFLGRASSASGRTRVGSKRPFGFAGKIFPTEDPDAVVPTLNFVTVDNLAGTRASHFLDTSLTNEPPTGFAFVPVLTLEIFFALTGADHKITSRPIEPLAEWGVADAQTARSPRWMMLRAAPGMPRVDEADFRRELDVSHYPKGLVLDIYGSRTTHDPKASAQWQKLGNVTLTESTVSYGCDRQLHFHHNKVGR